MRGSRRGDGPPGPVTGSLKEKGAVAVEFALVLPVFLVLVLGIFEFGLAFNIQVSLSQAARESARYAAIHSGKTGYDPEAPRAVGVAAAPSVPLTNANVTISYSNGGSKCEPGIDVLSTVVYSSGYVTGLDKMIGVAQPYKVTGKGVMRCVG